MSKLSVAIQLKLPHLSEAGASLHGEVGAEDAAVRGPGPGAKMGLLIGCK